MNYYYKYVLGIFLGIIFIHQKSKLFISQRFQNITITLLLIPKPLTVNIFCAIDF